MLHRLFVLLLLLPVVTARAPGCAAVLPNPADSVEIATEDVLIVYDAAKRLQHFIRRVDFGEVDAGFGFLVPTPSVPRISEADVAAFGRLGELLIPRMVYEKDYRLSMSPLGLLGAHAGSSLRSGVDGNVAYDDGVEVLEQDQVAGLDYAVLAASDGEALARWLKSNGYSYREALGPWLAPYVAEGYTITAFKLPGDRGAVLSGAVRMSFEAAQPFFPYREPADQRAEGKFDPKRLWRGWLVSNQRLEERLGSGPLPTSKVPYAARTAGLPELLAGALPADELPADATFVTCIEDRAAPRQGDADLVFVAAASQDEVRPEPIVIKRRVVLGPGLGGWLLLAVALALLSLPLAGGARAAGLGGGLGLALTAITLGLLYWEPALAFGLSTLALGTFAGAGFGWVRRARPEPEPPLQPER